MSGVVEVMVAHYCTTSLHKGITVQDIQSYTVIIPYPVWDVPTIMGTLKIFGAAQ